MIRILSSIILLTTGVLAACYVNRPDTIIDLSAGRQQLKITKIVDGDTFWAINQHNQNKKYRLIGIDAPEKSNSFQQKKHIYGDSATRALIQLLPDSVVYISFDKDSLDRYKRYLVYCFNSQNQFVNFELVRNGHAWAKNYPPNSRHQKLFLLAQDSAQNEQKGIWNNIN
ncbi:thermonuclease family protein [Gynurincola endophyticus]|uniref:thermonuclease family protein n=1 Tax=Gynurincola endophyticus TaxID=2479004 RepID=UPI000F8ED003|nr:thermonuclease family protein [Gynurincola endophyticus]